MCYKETFPCTSGDQCVHPFAEKDGEIMRAPYVDLCDKAKELLSAGKDAPIACQLPRVNKLEDPKMCRACERNKSTAYPTTSATNFPSVYHAMAFGTPAQAEAAFAESQGDEGAQHPVTASASTITAIDPFEQGFLATEDYIPIVMSKVVYEQQFNLPDNQLPTRATPTGQIVPQYFDYPVESSKRNNDFAEDRYTRGLNISNNQLLTLPLAYERIEDYSERQMGLPNGEQDSYAVLRDIWRAWSEDKSTPEEFVVKSRGYARGHTEIEYHPPFPQYANPAISTWIHGLVTQFRMGTSPREQALDGPPPPDPVWNSMTVQEQDHWNRVINDELKDKDHSWLTADGNLVAPAEWHVRWMRLFKQWDENGRAQVRYKWCRSMAPNDPFKLPYEGREDFLRRQAYYRFGNRAITDDDIHGLNYEYWECLMQVYQRGLLAYSSEGIDMFQKTTKWMERDRDQRRSKKG